MLGKLSHSVPSYIMKGGSEPLSSLLSNQRGVTSLSCATVANPFCTSPWCHDLIEYVQHPNFAARRCHANTIHVLCLRLYHDMGLLESITFVKH